MLGLPVVALCVGLPTMIAANRLAASFRRSHELVTTAPASTVARAAASCASAVVPAVLTSLWLVYYYATEGRLWALPRWVYGTLSRTDVAATIIGNSVVAVIGGTLLGVAAARWWRFRGSAVVLVAGIVIWTIGSLATFSAEGVPPAWTRWVRLFTPVNGFSSPGADGGSDTQTGSPLWYVVWLVTLCALAGLAALLKGSAGVTRRRLVRLGAGLLAVSALTYVLAAAGGNSSPVRTYADGHSVVLSP